jgi:16S rRNA (guanine527-N7)-methyltransferase
MTDPGYQWFVERDNVSRETLVRLDNFANLITRENETQNLIAASTIPTLWWRHFVDSAQLLDHVPTARNWLDLGSGPGLPGLVLAILSEAHITLVESRKKRVDFLLHATRQLDLDNVSIVGSRVEVMPTATFDAISARAFAPLDRLLPLAHRFTRPNTHWVLPKGRSARDELEQARGSWQGRFRIEPSVTDSEAAIIVADHVMPRDAAVGERR